MKINRVTRFFLIAALINLVVFAIIYFMPFNPIRSTIGYLTSLFVYIFGFGVKTAVLSTKNMFFLATTRGELTLYQTFYEFLTIIALTIPLYLRSWKKLAEKLALILFIMISYYVLLYGITILLLHNGFKVPFLLSFIKFNTESFMILIFGSVWFLVNKEKIMNVLRKH